MQTDDGGPSARERGEAMLDRLDRVGGARALDTLRATCPHLADYIVDGIFGGIYYHEGLELRTRELLTVAVLAAMGTAAPQLRFHVKSALEAGCTQTEITEALIQVSVLAGLPAAINGLNIAGEVFRESEG